MSTRICVRHRGPLVVEGDVELLAADGTAIDVSGMKRIALCRCGASKSKPLCDGSHNRVGFDPGESQ